MPERGLAVRGIGILLTVLSVVTILLFASLAYSGYMELRKVGGVVASLRPGYDEDLGAYKVELDIPNETYLPLLIEADIGLYVDGRRIAGGSDADVIRPGGVGRLEILVPLSDLESIEWIGLERLAFDGFDLDISARINASFGPLLAIGIEAGFGQRIGAMMKDLEIEVEWGSIERYNSTHSIVKAKLRFVNESQLQLKARAGLEIVYVEGLGYGEWGSGILDIDARPYSSYEGVFELIVPDIALGRGVYEARLVIGVKGERLERVVVIR